MNDFTHLNVNNYSAAYGAMTRIIEQYCSSNKSSIRMCNKALYGTVLLSLAVTTFQKVSTELLGHFDFGTETILLAKYNDILVQLKMINGKSEDTDYAAFEFWGTTEFPSELIDKFVEIGFSLTPKIDETKIPISYATIVRNAVEVTYKTFDQELFSTVRSNYTAGVQTAFEGLVSVIPAHNNGLIIMHGPPGTGKTHLIRSLMTEVSKESDRSFLVCIPPSAFVEDGSRLVEAINAVTNPIVIFEDLGVVFEQNYRSRNVDAFTTFINLSDGLLSHLTNAIFLLTFNETIQNMDKAMTRPGRCIANIEVPLLSVDEGRTLLGDDSSLMPTQRSGISLAEIYALKNGGPLEYSGERALFGFERAMNERT